MYEKIVHYCIAAVIGKDWLKMRQYKVVLADDEITIREGFKRLFDWEAHGCEIVGEAADGIAAINIVDTMNPDIVIMDINMPLMNGLEVIQILKRKYPRIAFIIVSGYDDFEYCREALRLKIVDYILKPVNFEEFGEIIDNLKITIYKDEEESVVEKSNENQLIFNMTGYLKEHLSEEITLKKLAEEFHLSPNYVGQVFKDKIGVNYQAYLTNLRIEEAKSLLLTTQKPVAEISELVGYNDYRIFTRTFKRIEKVPPTRYRKIL